jgi:hypothetical protein
MNGKGIFSVFGMMGLLCSALLCGCGGNGPGSPGSQGNEGTGMNISVADISFVKNTTADTASPNVDAFQEICDPGPPPKFEPFRDHGAVVTFTASLLNPRTTFPVGDLFIGKYTVDFRAKNDSIGAPPIEQFVGFSGVTIPAPAGTAISSVDASFMLVDLTRKATYATDVTTNPPTYTFKSSFINNYTATYTFEGQNANGVHFTLVGQTDFAIGDYNNCP